MCARPEAALIMQAGKKKKKKNIGGGWGLDETQSSFGYHSETRGCHGDYSHCSVTKMAPAV